MSGPASYYVTTPIYYVNGEPHLGHAYTTIACDALARFMRLDGRRVKFLTGTDEHGQKVERSAQAAGMSPQEFADLNAGKFREVARLVNASNDDFIRTTEPRHIQSAQALWRKMEEAGDIYLGKYAGWYATRDETYYGEDELRVVNGKRLAPTGAEVEWVEEESYFFRLSAWQDRLLAFYEANPGFILPETRRNEVLSFVRSGLRDFSVSRTTFNWGIKVPGAESHVMYVWVDALTNYITALGYPDTDAEEFRAFWPADLHMVGKDITRFHAVYWPAMLMSAGLEPPRRVFVHGLLLDRQGEKMSKSVGNVISPQELIGRYGIDQVRYFLMREVPFGNDGNIGHDLIVHRINGDLANDLGNLSQRVLSMIQKNCAAAVPQPGDLTGADRELLGAAESLLPAVRTAMEVPAFHRALEHIWSVIADANRYVDAQAPWALRKTDPARMATVLYVLAETIRRVTLLVQPFMPEASGRILDQLAVPEERRDFAAFGETGTLVPGTPLPVPQGVFPRVVVEAEQGA